MVSSYTLAQAWTFQTNRCPEKRDLTTEYIRQNLLYDVVKLHHCFKKLFINQAPQFLAIWNKPLASVLRPPPTVITYIKLLEIFGTRRTPISPVTYLSQQLFFIYWIFSLSSLWFLHVRNRKHHSHHHFRIWDSSSQGFAIINFSTDRPLVLQGIMFQAVVEGGRGFLVRVAMHA